VTALDERIARPAAQEQETRPARPNKADSGQEKIADISEFHRLGFGEPFYISRKHGNGEAELRIAVLALLGRSPRKTRARGAAAHLFRRPAQCRQVLRLSNRLLKSDVDCQRRARHDARRRRARFHLQEPGRQAVALSPRRHRRHPLGPKLPFVGGIFLPARSLEAIHNADVAFMVLDAMDGVTQRTRRSPGEIIKAQSHRDRREQMGPRARRVQAGGVGTSSKAERDYREKFEKALFDQLFFTPGAPVMFVSALPARDPSACSATPAPGTGASNTKIPTAS